LFANICPSTTARPRLVGSIVQIKVSLSFYQACRCGGIQRFKMYVGKYRFHGEGNRSGEEPEV
jgi:hypothetical protein